MLTHHNERLRNEAACPQVALARASFEESIREAPFRGVAHFPEDFHHGSPIRKSSSRELRHHVAGLVQSYNSVTVHRHALVVNPPRQPVGLCLNERVMLGISHWVDLGWLLSRVVPLLANIAMLPLS